MVGTPSDGASTLGGSVPATGSQPDGRARRWRGQRNARRREIVDAALAVIAEHGTATTTEDIAERAGLPRPGIYRHFDDRDDLHGAIAQRVLGSYSAAMTAMWNPRGSPQEMVSAAIDGHLGWLSANGSHYRYVLRVSHECGAVADLRDSVIDHLRDLLAAGLLGPRLAGDRAEYLAASAVALADTVTRRWLEGASSWSRTELAGELERSLLAMIDAALRAEGIHLNHDDPVDDGYDADAGPPS